MASKIERAAEIERQHLEREASARAQWETEQRLRESTETFAAARDELEQAAVLREHATAMLDVAHKELRMPRVRIPFIDRNHSHFLDVLKKI